MALYRTISLSFWTDAKVVDSFTPEDRYFYLYLFTNPHTNLAGCYEISIRTMVNETGYSKETIERLLVRFVNEHQVIDYFPDTKEILLINWHKYNWTTSEKYRKPLLSEINKVKCDYFRDQLLKIFNGEIDRYGIDTNCIGTNCSDTSNTNTITNTNTVSNKKDSYLDIVNNIMSERNYSDFIYNTLITWITYKKERGQTYKPTGLKSLLNKVDKALLEYTEQQIIDLINECMSRNYQGIIFDMLDNKKTGGSAYMDAIKCDDG